MFYLVCGCVLAWVFSAQLKQAPIWNSLWPGLADFCAWWSYPGICLGLGWHPLSLFWGDRLTLHECRRTSAAPQAFSQPFTFHSHPHKGQNSFPAISWENALDHPPIRDTELGPRALLRGADARSSLTQNYIPRSPNKPLSICCVLLHHGPAQLVQLGYTMVEGEERCNPSVAETVCTGKTSFLKKLAVHRCSAATVTPGKGTHGACSCYHHGTSSGRPWEEVPLWFGSPFFKTRRVVFRQGKKHTSSSHTEIKFSGSQTWHESYESYLNELFALNRGALHRFLFFFN